MKKFLFLTVSVCVLGVGVLAYGNMPQKTDHENSVLKSEGEQSFSEKDGVYKEYSENGQLIREVPYQKGVISGLQKEYLSNGVRLESNYVDGKREGETKLYVSPQETYSWHYQQGRLSGKFNLFDNWTGTIDSDNHFVCSLSSDSADVMTGKLLCDEDKLIPILLNNDLDQREMELVECVNIEHVNYTQKQTNTPISISFDGGFTFPKFTELSSIRISGDPFLFDLKESLQREGLSKDTFSAADVAFYQPQYLNIIVQEGNKNAQLKLMNAENKQILNMEFDVPFTISAYEPDKISTKEYREKVLFEMAKNILFSHFNLFTPTGRVAAQFQGKIQILKTQIEKASRFDIFNLTGQSIIGFEKTDKGMLLSLAYPKSGKKMVSFEAAADLPNLEKMRERFDNATSFEDIERILNGGELLIPTQRHVVTVPHFEWYDINGKIVAQTQNLIFDMTAPEGQRLKGDIRLNKSEQEQAVVYLTDNFDQIKIEKNNGELLTVDFDGLFAFLGNYISGDVKVNTIDAYVNELDERGQMNKIGFELSRFFQRLMLGGVDESYEVTTESNPSYNSSDADESHEVTIE